MDKYEFNLKIEQIKRLAGEGDYVTAAKIADTLNVAKIKRLEILQCVADAYENVEEYEKAKDILEMIESKAGANRHRLYKLCILSVKLKDLEDAKIYYKEYNQMASDSSSKYLLQYEIAEACEANNSDKIKIIEKYINIKFDDEWIYKLITLYHKEKMGAKVVDLTDKLFLFYGPGEYTDKALEIKRLYTKLTPEQQVAYEETHKLDSRIAPDAKLKYVHTGELLSAREAIKNAAFNEAFENVQYVEKPSYTQREMYEEQPVYENAPEYETAPVLQEEPYSEETDVNVKEEENHAYEEQEAPVEEYTYTREPVDFGSIRKRIHNVQSEQLEEERAYEDAARKHEEALASLKEKEALAKAQAEAEAERKAKERENTGEVLVEGLGHWEETENGFVYVEPQTELKADYSPDYDGLYYDEEEKRAYEKARERAMQERFENMGSEETKEEPSKNPDDDMKVHDEIDVNEIHIKEVDVNNKYNTVNIQEALAESMAALYEGGIKTAAAEEVKEPTKTLTFINRKQLANRDTVEVVKAEETAKTAKEESVNNTEFDGQISLFDWLAHKDDMSKEPEVSGESEVEAKEAAEDTELEEAVEETAEETEEETVEFSEEPEETEEAETEETVEESEEDTEDTENEEESEDIEETVEGRTDEEGYDEPDNESDDVVRTAAKSGIAGWFKKKIDSTKQSVKKYLDSIDESDFDTEDITNLKKEIIEADKVTDDEPKETATEEVTEETATEEVTEEAATEEVTEETTNEEAAEEPEPEEVSDKKKLQDTANIITEKLEEQILETEAIEREKLREKALSEKQAAINAVLEKEGLQDKEEEEIKEDKSEAAEEPKPKKKVFNDVSAEAEPKKEASYIKTELKQFIHDYGEKTGLGNGSIQIMKDIVKGMDKGGSSVGGCIYITGDIRSGKTTLATDIIRITNELKRRYGRKLAKTSAMVINKRGIMKSLSELENTDVIIEKAGYLTKQDLLELVSFIKGDTKNMLIVLESDLATKERMFATYPQVAKLFVNGLDIQPFGVKAAAVYAKNYANKCGYKIDEIGTLALHATLDKEFSANPDYKKEDVETLLDAIIEKHEKQKVKRFFNRLSGVGENVLMEEDFI